MLQRNPSSALLGRLQSAVVALFAAALVSCGGVGTNNTKPDAASPIVAKFAYVANQGGNTISQFSRNADGTLMPLSTPTVSVGTGTGPYAIAHDPLGHYLYVTEFSKDVVAQYVINNDGTLSAQPTATIATGTGARGIVAEPTGRFVYVVNGTAGSISQYFINSDGTLGALSPATVLTVASPQLITADNNGHVYVFHNTSPGHISMYHVSASGALDSLGGTASGGNVANFGTTAGTFLYIPNGSSANVGQFSIGTDGLLTALTPAAATAGTTPQAVAVSPGGQFAYVSSGSGSISQYSIGSDGTLTPLAPPTVATGTPFVLQVDPSGKVLYVVNQTAKTVSQFSIGSDGTLTPLSTPSVTVGTNPIFLDLVSRQ